jgi:transposase InsO family protein
VKFGRPKAALVGDITYLPLKNGRFCYLATFQDKYARRIVGWAVAASMSAEASRASVGDCHGARLVEKNGVIHTDRGSQFVSNAYRELLRRQGVRDKQRAGKGNCYSSAQAESFRCPLQNRGGRAAESLSWSNKPGRKPSATLKVIRIGSDYILGWVTKARWNLSGN